MTLRLYLDECAYSKALVDVLHGQPYGHYVETPVYSGLIGEDDAPHFNYAVSRGLVIVTKDTDDFEELHARFPDHPGIIAVYQNNRPSDLSPAEIANAIQNLVDAGVELAGGFHRLNYWHYPRR